MALLLLVLSKPPSADDGAQSIKPIHCIYKVGRVCFFLKFKFMQSQLRLWLIIIISLNDHLSTCLVSLVHKLGFDTQSRESHDSASQNYLSAEPPSGVNTESVACLAFIPVNTFCLWISTANLRADGVSYSCVKVSYELIKLRAREREKYIENENRAWRIRLLIAPHSRLKSTQHNYHHKRQGHLTDWLTVTANWIYIQTARSYRIYIYFLAFSCWYTQRLAFCNACTPSRGL